MALGPLMVSVVQSGAWSTRFRGALSRWPPGDNDPVRLSCRRPPSRGHGLRQHQARAQDLGPGAGRAHAGAKAQMVRGPSSVGQAGASRGDLGELIPPGPAFPSRHLGPAGLHVNTNSPILLARRPTGVHNRAPPEGLRAKPLTTAPSPGAPRRRRGRYASPGRSGSRAHSEPAHQQGHTCFWSPGPARSEGWPVGPRPKGPTAPSSRSSLALWSVGGSICRKALRQGSRGRRSRATEDLALDLAVNLLRVIRDVKEGLVGGPQRSRCS